MNIPTCQRCAELEAKLARVQAKSARRHKALHELNKAMRIAQLMVSEAINSNRRLRDELRTLEFAARNTRKSTP